MGAFATALIAAALLCAPEKERPLLMYSGNRVMIDEVYTAAIDLPKEATATAYNSRLVKARALDFLRRSGYELATVKTRIIQGQIRIDIDEGRVDKVIVFGQGAYKTLRVKLELSLPHNVFNRPLLERQLREVADRYNFRNYRYDLVPVQKQSHVGPQIVDLGQIQDVEVIPPEEPYELHITLESHDWEIGLSPDVSFNSLEGLGFGLRDRERSSFIENDRLELRSRIGATIRDTIDETRTRPVLGRVFAEAKWHTPPLIGDAFRSFLWLRGDLVHNQRADLGIGSFYYAPLEASGNAEYQFLRELTASIGFGIEHRRVFEIHGPAVQQDVLADTPRQQTRPFTRAGLELWLNPDVVRRDRKHALNLEARGYSPGATDRQHTLRLDYSYQGMTTFGWNELWIRSRGTTLHGDVLFSDEQAIGNNHLRGPFSALFYVRRLASVGAEYRVSLVRDLFKVSAYHDLVAFGRFDRAADRTVRPSVANAFGAGAHVLIIDAFQLDAYYGVGFARGGRFDHGFTPSVQQAF